MRWLGRLIGSRAGAGLIAGWEECIYRGKRRHGDGIASSRRLSRYRVQRDLSMRRTLLFLIQLNDWQAVYAENGGDFAAVMDVMFEHMPDDPLERNCGSHFSSQTRRIQPHLGVCLERGLDQFRVTHTFRII